MNEHDLKELWNLEEAFWLGGQDRFVSSMHRNCIMVFPEPVGILAGEAIVASLADAPRRRSVEMTGRTARILAPDTVCLAYRARGRRDAPATYNAYCASTYVRQGSRWCIGLHQQTPVQA